MVSGAWCDPGFAGLLGDQRGDGEREWNCESDVARSAGWMDHHGPILQQRSDLSHGFDDVAAAGHGHLERAQQERE